MKVGTLSKQGVSQHEKESVKNGLKHTIKQKIHEFSNMCPNLGRVGRDPGQLGQCPIFHRLLVLKDSLICASKMNFKIFHHFYLFLSVQIYPKEGRRGLKHRQRITIGYSRRESDCCSDYLKNNVNSRLSNQKENTKTKYSLLISIPPQNNDVKQPGVGEQSTIM